MPPQSSTPDVVSVQVDSPPHLEGMVLSWNIALLDEFVHAANHTVLIEQPELELPRWLTEPRGALTTQGVIHDTMSNLAEISGGWRGTTLSPNTQLQTLHLCTRMGQLEMHPFMQACAKKLSISSPLVSVRHFLRDPTIDSEPMNFASLPSPYRQIFE